MRSAQRLDTPPGSRSRAARVGALIYSVLGLVIFAGYTMFDFRRLRLSRDIRSAPLLAASIFLDILNVFLFFLQIFSREQ